MLLAYGDSIEYEYLQTEGYRVVKCTNCSFLYQQQVLNGMGLTKLYDKWINPDDALRWHQQSVEKNQVVYSQRVRFVARHFGNNNINMLDWGGGFGQFCQLARAYGMNVHCTEISLQRRKFMDDRGIKTMSMGSLPESYFHFVNLDQVLEHVSEPLALLKETHSVLRHRGVLFVSSPNTHGLERKLRVVDGLSLNEYKTVLLDVAPLQHVNCFTHTTLTRICNLAGFRMLFRPFLYIRCSNFGTSIKETLQNVGRPFYHRFGTAFFLIKD